MLSVLYINRAPELVRTAAQHLSNLSEQHGGDQHERLRSARAERSGGLAGIVRGRPRASKIASAPPPGSLPNSYAPLFVIRKN